MARCQICKQASTTTKIPICHVCRIRGAKGQLSWMRKRRFRSLFLTLRNMEYEKVNPDEYRFVQEVLVKNGISIPSGEENILLRNWYYIAGIVVAIIAFLTYLNTLS